MSRKKVGLPNFNGSTIEIPPNKKGGPNKWYHFFDIERLERIELVMDSFRDQGL